VPCLFDSHAYASWHGLPTPWVDPLLHASWEGCPLPAVHRQVAWTHWAFSLSQVVVLLVGDCLGSRHGAIKALSALRQERGIPKASGFEFCSAARAFFVRLCDLPLCPVALLEQRPARASAVAVQMHRLKTRRLYALGA
jgi:hypothetical protein